MQATTVTFPMKQTNHFLLTLTLLVFAFLLTISPAAAQTDVATSAESATKFAGDGPLFSDGRVIGKIVDKWNRPIEGVSLQLIRTDLVYPYHNYWATEGIFSATTGANGVYDFTNVEYGEYHLQVKDYQDRYAAMWLGAPLFDRAAAETISITDSTMQSYDMQLEWGASISGYISYRGQFEDQSPVISIWYVEDGQYALIKEVYLDGPGTFKIDGLPAGKVKISASDYLPTGSELQYFPQADTFEDGQWIETTLGQTRRGIRMTLGQSGLGVIKGTVTGHDNRLVAPVRAANVCLYAPDHGSWYTRDCVEADGLGRYRFDNILPGDYKVEFSDPNNKYHAVFNGGVNQLAHASLVTLSADSWLTVDGQMPRGGSITGQLIAALDGYNISYSSVRLDRWNATLGQFEYVDAYEFRQTRGQFEIGGLQPGEYQLYLYSEIAGLGVYEKWYGSSADAPLATSIIVGESQTMALGDILMGDETGVIEGVVYGSNGRPLANADVTIVSDDYIRHEGLEVTTDWTGAFRVVGLPAGSYKVRVTDASGRHATAWNNNVATPELAWPIHLAVGQTRHVTFNLNPGASISGHVDVAGNSSHNYQQVVLYRFHKGQWETFASQELAADEMYRFAGLPAGGYRVKAEIGIRAYAYETYSAQFSRWYAGDESPSAFSSAEVIQLSAGRHVTDVDIDMLVLLRSPYDPIGVMNGHVTDSSGNGVSGIRVYLYRFIQGRRSSYFVQERVTTTDRNGQYWMNDLESGVYRIGFKDVSGEYQTAYGGDTTLFDAAPTFNITVTDRTQREVTVDAILSAAPAAASDVTLR